MNSFLIIEIATKNKAIIEINKSDKNGPDTRVGGNKIPKIENFVL